MNANKIWMKKGKISHRLSWDFTLQFQTTKSLYYYNKSDDRNQTKYGYRLSPVSNPKHKIYVHTVGLERNWRPTTLPIHLMWSNHRFFQIFPFKDTHTYMIGCLGHNAPSLAWDFKIIIIIVEMKFIIPLVAKVNKGQTLFLRFKGLLFQDPLFSHGHICSELKV